MNSIKKALDVFDWFSKTEYNMESKRRLLRSLCIFLCTRISDPSLQTLMPLLLNLYRQCHSTLRYSASHGGSPNEIQSLYKVHRTLARLITLLISVSKAQYDDYVLDVRH